MIRWPVTKPATTRRSRAPRMTAEARARKCEFLARRLEVSGESRSAEIARALAAGHRRVAGVSP